MDTNDKANTVGNRIRQIRKHQGLTQAELAKILNVAVPTVSDVENNKTMPSFELIEGLSTHFNMNLEFLIHGKGELYKETEEITFTINEKNFGEVAEEILNVMQFTRHTRVFRTILANLTKDIILKYKDLIDQELSWKTGLDKIRQKLLKYSKPWQNNDNNT